MGRSAAPSSAAPIFPLGQLTVVIPRTAAIIVLIPKNGFCRSRDPLFGRSEKEADSSVRLSLLRLLGRDVARNDKNKLHRAFTAR
jgi:hypothetical protein